MVRRVHELRFFHFDRELERHRIVAVIDLDDPDVTEDLLNRHLFGAVRRAGGGREVQHEFVVQVHDPNAEGDRADVPLVRWALPADPEAW